MFHTFHLDRSSIVDMTWRGHGILRIATMILDLVHVGVTEFLVMLLWNQLLRFNEYALCALVHIDLSFIVDIISNYGILRIATMMQSLVHVNVTESLVMLLWDQL